MGALPSLEVRAAEDRGRQATERQGGVRRAGKRSKGGEKCEGPVPLGNRAFDVVELIGIEPTTS
jgi:hypothetical protein